MSVWTPISGIISKIMQQVAKLKDAVFPVGYNDSNKPDDLPDGRCVLAQNCFLDGNMIEERHGYTIYGSDTGEGTPNLGFCAFEVGATKQLIKINNSIAAGTPPTSPEAYMYYKTASGDWTKVTTYKFTAGLPVSMVVAQGKLYMANGTDKVRVWNGTTMTESNTIPITYYLIWFHNFLWALGNATYKNRAYYSNLGDPDTFGAADYIDISPDDSDVITGAFSLRDEMFITKQFRSYSFQGWTEASFSIQLINDMMGSYGATSAIGFANTGNDLLFPSYNGNIPAIRSMKRTSQGMTEYGGCVTEEIETTMNGLSKAYLNKISSVYDGKYVWFFLPTGSDSYNSLALTLDPSTGGWMKHTGIYAARAVVSTISGQTEVFFADSRNSKVYKFDTSNSDNGANIDFQFISRQFRPDNTRKTKWKYLWVRWTTGSSGSLVVWCSPDGFEYHNIETISLATAPATEFTFAFTSTFSTTDEGSKRINLPYKAFHGIQVKFVKNDATTRTQIRDFEFQGYEKKIRDN